MSEAPAYSPDLQAISDAIKANEQSVRELLETLSEDELNRPPAGGGWSILQCLEHLVLANQIYCAAIGGSLSGAARPGKGALSPSVLGRMFLKQLEPPVTRKTRSPGKITPRSGRGSDPVLAAFAQSHDTIRALLEKGRNLDLNATKFRNPLLPLIRVRAGTGLLILPAHERRHLWQAKRVKEEILRHR